MVAGQIWLAACGANTITVVATCEGAVSPNKSLLGELGVDCEVYGFYIGPNSTPGPETRDTRQMAELVSQGVTPIPAFYAPHVEADVISHVAEIVWW